MDIFTMLKKDHRKVEEMFEKLCGTTERGAKTRMEGLERLEQELEVHMQIEEQILYPALRANEDTRELALDAYAEHEAATDVLKKLKTIPADSEMWKAWLGVLKQNVLHHAEEEEKEIFEQARQALEREEIQEMTRRAEAMKAELQSRARRGEDHARFDWRQPMSAEPRIEAEEE